MALDSRGDADVAILDNIPDTSIQLQDIFLDNGQDVRTYLQISDPSYLH
jgi:hypothetical protein